MFLWTRPPRVVGHRGNPAEHAENTLAGFLSAAEAGARAIELDVRMTRDGTLVVHHDAELGRVVPGEGLIEELRREEIPDLVPTLAAVLAALPGDFLVDAEIKADAGNAEQIAEAMARVVDAAEARERVLATSFAPELAADYAKRVGRPAGMILPFPPGADDLEPWPELPFVMLAADAAIPESVEPILESGRVPAVWTVNGADEAEGFLAMGCASIITDKPRALVTRLGRG